MEILIYKKKITPHGGLTSTQKILYYSYSVDKEIRQMPPELQYLDKITVEEIVDAYDFHKNNINCETIKSENLITILKKIEDVLGDASNVHIVYIIDIINLNKETVLVDKFGVLGIQRELYRNKKLRGCLL